MLASEAYVRWHYNGASIKRDLTDVATVTLQRQGYRDTATFRALHLGKPNQEILEDQDVPWPTEG